MTANGWFGKGSNQLRKHKNAIK